MDRLITLREAADRLSVSPDFLRKLRRESRLTIVKLGRAVRVPAAEIERLAREGVSRGGA